MDKDKIAYQQLLKGIQDYVKKCIEDCGYDKTYTALVTDINHIGYTILLNGRTYENIRTVGGTCKVDETVKVMIPQNNFSNMFILK